VGVDVEVKNIKFWDKTQPLEMMAKNLQLLNVKVEVDHKTDLAELIEASWGDDVRVVNTSVKHVELQGEPESKRLPTIGGPVGPEAEEVQRLVQEKMGAVEEVEGLDP
jgi:hypothetical protein